MPYLGVVVQTLAIFGHQSGAPKEERKRRIVAVIGSASAACSVPAADVSKEFGRLVEGMQK